MKTITAAQAAELDRYAIEELNIPSRDLMETAGRLTADIAQSYLEQHQKKQVLVVCGFGNNAGDGFVIARHLAKQGFAVEIVMLGEENHLKPDARANYERAFQDNIPLLYLRAFLKSIQSADLVIDAIFGFGLNRSIEEPIKSIIKGINELGRHVISVDVPSGLDATTGQVHGCCVRANQTVTFTAAKTGFYQNAGPEYVGDVKVVDIGVPLTIDE